MLMNKLTNFSILVFDQFLIGHDPSGLAFCFDYPIDNWVFILLLFKWNGIRTNSSTAVAVESDAVSISSISCG